MSARAREKSRVIELTPCPSWPRCVSTETLDESRRLAPFSLVRVDAWREIRAVVLSLPRTKLAREADHFLHIECRSTLFGFVDDLEVQLRAADGVLSVRSGARIGYYDLGVNRRRVQKLRELLQLRGLVR